MDSFDLWFGVTMVALLLFIILGVRAAMYGIKLMERHLVFRPLPEPSGKWKWLKRGTYHNQVVAAQKALDKLKVAQIDEDISDIIEEVNGCLYELSEAVRIEHGLG